MTQPIALLDAGELTAWLMRLSQTVDRSLREPARSAALAALRDGFDEREKIALPVLIQLAFLSDCLHVAHLAIGADGRIETAELERVADLVLIAASKYFLAVPDYESFDEEATSVDDVARFLRVHREDAGPFGFQWREAWRGLALARRVEQATRNAAPLRDHERMLSRIMEAVFAGRSTEVEQVARRRLRDLFEQPGAPRGADPRAIAFCRSDGPEVFSSVAHGSHFHERDPFDIDTIHGEARERFHREVDRKTTPEHARSGQGSMMLVLGGSGAGKTHVLRAMRNQVHGRRQGYVGYLQLAPDIEDYTRYVLRSVIDSLERSYDAPELTESSLMYLSDGLVEGRVPISPDDLERLRIADLAPAQLEQLVGKLVDHVVRGEGLGMLETDLVQALLLLQRRDPAIHRRVVRFLRGESLTGYDRELLGGLAARDKPEDPLRTIRQLATIMHELQLAALVIVVDQIEDVLPNAGDAKQIVRLQQALDALRAIADSVPSAVIVLSCLDDVYDQAKQLLSQSLRDRLERNEVRLSTKRQPDEIEQMLTRRLEHLYNFFDVAWREDDPIYPFTPAQLEAVSQYRIRDCLSKFREYHAQCIAARKIVEPRAAEPVVDVRTTSPGLGTPPKLPAPPADLAELDRQWTAALKQAKAPDEATVLTLIGDTLRGASTELGRELTIKPNGATDLPCLVIEGARVPRRTVAICNNAPQRGSFTNQLASLRAAAGKLSAMPVALRNGEIKFQPKTKTAQYVGEMVAAGGLLIALTEEQLRTAVAARALSAVHPDGFAIWQRDRQPLAALPFVRQLLGLDREHDAAPSLEATDSSDTLRIDASEVAVIVDREPAAPSGAEAAPPHAPHDAPPAIERPAHAVRLGVTDSLRADPILLPLEDIKTHVAFLGSTGSGKTTAALSVVEQLLERGVSVLMIDRKGDLARYVDDDWWRDPKAPEAERRRELRRRIEVELFTPGNPHGRPLRLPLIPSLADVKRQDRELLAGYAAEGLGAMMGYGKSTTHKHKASVLKCAIELHGDARGITLNDLLETISRPDPELLNAVGSLQRHFAGLTEDLQTLLIQRGNLLSGEGEPLDIAALLPPHGTGKPRLSIINTSAFTDISVLQFWVSRLLVEIGRLGRQRPSESLQAAVFFDEADTYLPVNSMPPTKEPMFDLLRRSRSTGIGVLLATQNPGDLDYKGRDNIITWLLGKIAQTTAIGKMRNLIGNYPDVGPRLASQRTGSFFLLTGTTKRELKADRSMMETRQLSDSEVAELARKARSPRSAG